MRKLIISVALITSISYGANYIVPYHYDNVLNGIKSKDMVGFMTGESGLFLSKKKYTLAGTTVRFKCKKIRKIAGEFKIN